MSMARETEGPGAGFGAGGCAVADPDGEGGGGCDLDEHAARAITNKNERMNGAKPFLAQIVARRYPPVVAAGRSSPRSKA
jgi:hypothetical protein